MATKQVKQTKQVKKQPKKVVTQSKLWSDFKSAALVVSVLINIAVFVGWLAIKLTNQYDSEVIYFLFSR